MVLFRSDGCQLNSTLSDTTTIPFRVATKILQLPCLSSRPTTPSPYSFVASQAIVAQQITDGVASSNLLSKTFLAVLPPTLFAAM